MPAPRKCRAILLAAALTPGCNAEDESVFKSSGGIEAKPEATGLAAVRGKSAEPPHRSAAVTYLVEVTTNSGSVPCRGRVPIEIMSDFSVSLPQAKLECLSMTVDLSGLLGAATGGGGAGGLSKSLEAIEYSGKVLRFKELAGAKFDPPRPFLLGPIVQNADLYAGYDETTEHTLTATDTETGQTISADGSFTVKVLEHQREYEKNGNEFDNVMHWTLEAKGFDTPGKYGLTIEKFEWYWNTRPIMIPTVIITGKLSDFITGKSAAMAAAVVGKVTVSINVETYDIK